MLGNDWIYLGLFSAFILLLLIIGFVTNVVLPLKEEAQYIKMEMNRSIGGEYRYWKRKLKQLYISYIPVYRAFYFKKHR
ncbi:MAG: hypothetical protein E7391_08455 [Ruminococcaceae bacterium]|nr:hypothetical protein [Oscillospiraceae bacterium]